MDRRLNLNILSFLVGLAVLAGLTACNDGRGFKARKYTSEEVSEWELKNRGRNGNGKKDNSTEETESTRPGANPPAAEGDSRELVPPTGAAAQPGPLTGAGETPDGANPGGGATNSEVGPAQSHSSEVRTGSPGGAQSKTFLEVEPTNQWLSESKELVMQKSEELAQVLKGLELVLRIKDQQVLFEALDMRLELARGVRTLHVAKNDQILLRHLKEDERPEMISFTMKNSDGEVDAKDVNTAVQITGLCEDEKCDQVFVRIRAAAKDDKIVNIVLLYKKHETGYTLLNSNLPKAPERFSESTFEYGYF